MLESGLELACDAVNSVLEGQCKVIGGMVIGRVVVVTLNNGYTPGERELSEMKRIMRWDNIASCRGAVVIYDSIGGTIGYASIAPEVGKPYINHRLAHEAM